MDAADGVRITGVTDPVALGILARVGVGASPGTPGVRPRGVVSVSAGGATVDVRLEVCGVVGAAIATRLAAAPEGMAGAPRMVVAERITDEARGILRTLGIGYASGTGHLHLAVGGVFLHVEVPARRRVEHRPPAGRTRLRDVAGRVAQALLLDPTRPWPVHELSRRAGASPGLTHRVLAQLEAEGLVRRDGTGRSTRRQVVDIGALLDRWAEENEDRGVEVVTGFRAAPSAEELMRVVAAGFEAASLGYAMTRGAAVALLAPGATRVTRVDVWVGWDTHLDDALAVCKALPATRGADLALMRVRGDAPLAFGERRGGMTCVDPVRLYFDLVGSDPGLAARLRQVIVQR